MQMYPWIKTKKNKNLSDGELQSESTFSVGHLSQNYLP